MIRSQLRLQHGGAYQSDIRELRRLVRANGTSTRHMEIQITCPNDPHSKNDTLPSVRFYMHLAYQPSDLFPAVSESLYTVAFSNNDTEEYHFQMSSSPGAVRRDSKLVRLHNNGDYDELNAQKRFPCITKNNLQQSVFAVAKHKGAYLSDDIKHALVRLLVAVNEAVRFYEVEDRISEVLGGSRASYEPDGGKIHNWGAHSLGGSPEQQDKSSTSGR